MSTSAHKRRGRFRNRPGQGLVEFVLIAPLLLLLILGLVHFARAWNIRHVITDAAREGARNIVIVDPNVDVDSVRRIINSAMATSGLDTTQATVDIDDSGQISGTPARVTITYPYTIGILHTILGLALSDAQFNITTTFVMRNEPSN